MSTSEQPLNELSLPARPAVKLDDYLSRLIYLDLEKVAYLSILVLAILTRFWDLGARVMSHDESLHTRFSWSLYQGQGFSHTPLMHGPLLFHMTAFFYSLFGDNDYTARIYTAILGIIVVMLPLLMRRWLGRWGALAASFMLLISPMMLYYSRYIREDMPSILGALIMVIAIWHYLEDRKQGSLLWLAFGLAIVYASKEVSFIYVAVFGSFLTLFFISRLLDAEWKSGPAFVVFLTTLIMTMVQLLLLTAVFAVQNEAKDLAAGGQALNGLQAFMLESGNPIRYTLIVSTAVTLLILAGAVMIGQWQNLRRFPELDMMIIMGALILPSLTPLISLLSFIEWNPMGDSQQDINTSLALALPVLAFSLIVGVIWGMKRPERRPMPAFALREADGPTPMPTEESPGEPEPRYYKLDLLDWLTAAFASRFWPIFALYWIFFIFFFTTMFTNGTGLGTGLLGSLGYWLEQHGVQRGGQPWYYYMLITVPLYEFMPAILSVVAAIIGLRAVVKRLIAPASPQPAPADASVTAEEADEADVPSAAPQRPRLDLDAPIQAPALLFTGYWALLNIFAYSVAGEKMPWLTTHITVPLIVLGGWVVGRALERIEWRSLWERSGWLALPLIPLLFFTFLRVIAPACRLVPVVPLCNTLISVEMQQRPFAGPELGNLAATGAWLGALLVLIGAGVAAWRVIQWIGAGQFVRLCGLFLIGGLAFLTARSAWIAAYVNYDLATEHIVYAHSSGAVKDVMDQIEEISLKTTDGYGLQVAYDNLVSWPMTWYLRDYENAIYYGESPSRGVIGEAPVVIAGSGHWAEVERILGNSYYRFEYIRMWWPMEDYKDIELPDVFWDIATDPELQRGLWNIFYRRDYSTYADAVVAYRGGNSPSFALNQWPLADRMRVYIRKDVYAQVWEYGVAASEFEEVLDPYGANVLPIQPDIVFADGVLSEPHNITIGPDGLLYVADTLNHRIAVFDQEGNFVTSYGGQGLAPAAGVLNEPWDVAVAEDGAVFVADTWNGRVTSFQPGGAPGPVWGSEGANQLDNPLGFWGPRGIAVAQDGFVLVADTGNKRIQVFDREGQFIRQIGVGGVLEGQLDEPVGLAVDSTGTIYVADTWNQRIQLFNVEGFFLGEWPVEAWFAQTNERPYLHVERERNAVFMTDPDASRVVVFDLQGSYRFTIGSFEQLGIVGGVTSSGDSVFITDTLNGTISRYDLSGYLGSAQAE